MEIYIKHIPQCALWQIQAELAGVLHNDYLLQHTGVPVNFDLHLIPSKTIPGQHAGYGFLTVPTYEVGELFLEQVEGKHAPTKISIHGRRLWFTQSNSDPRPDTVQNITRLPYIDADAVRRKQELEEELHINTVSLSMIQFGWETRDRPSRYSVEWERSFDWDCSLTFGGERREMRIELYGEDYTHSIVIHLSHIEHSMAGSDRSGQPIIFLRLFRPPSFERKISLAQQIARGTKRNAIKSERLCSFDPLDPHHARVIPYTSIAIRLVCRDHGGPELFQYLCSKVRLRRPDVAPHSFPAPVTNLGLFSLLNFRKYERWIKHVHWRVAFQVESMLRSLVASLRDILDIRSRILSLEQDMGPLYAADLLRRFSARLKIDMWGSNQDLPVESFFNYYRRMEAQLIESMPEIPPSPFLNDPGVFESFHIAVTPTIMALEGPLPERSNRVMRMYPKDHDCFLRVSFMDENRLQYRSNRDIDGPLFINSWITRILHEGMVVAGRKFRFLGYSQSALKSHTVWFVLDDPERPELRVENIIRGLGQFDNLKYDRQLIYCPARYGARISQAFTATDPSIVVRAEEVFLLEDIKRGQWCFTEGVGTLSRAMAKAISKTLKDSGKRAFRRLTTHPGAFQVRFQGSKGVVTVDPRLRGNAICVRPSMIKFEAPESLDVEIAQAFDRPSKYYLNRPLIMILEALGVPYRVFDRLQTRAITQVHKASRSLRGLAEIMEAYGLGTSYRLPSIFLSLSKLHVEAPPDDSFFHRVNDFTVHHILRDLKHHARIPLDRHGWTLVGVADIHGWLREKEVYAYIRLPDGEAFYLEGRVMVSRSPTIHPGDVQVLTAVKPPHGSIYLREPLANTLVFSIQGTRPVYTGLGGGDLDGDLYNVTTLRELMPPKNYHPANYDPAVKRILDRRSTIHDIADFVADYINSDIIGLVAINWLIIADQSPQGIFDPDCLSLCELHSNAVDYPKSGNPVSAKAIPFLKFSAKPDWNAPETVDLKDTANYYQSEKAIGRLFRAVTLPDLNVDGGNFEFNRQLGHTPEADLDEVFAKLCMENEEYDDPWNDAVKNRVAQFIDVEPDSAFVGPAVELLNSYVVDLASTCANNTISTHRLSMLSEEEAIVGTIVAKCSQKNRRKECMAKLREQTEGLVKGIRAGLIDNTPLPSSVEDNEDEEAQEDAVLKNWLAQAWAAWQVSRVEDAFGCTSFGWIALGDVFDAIKAIEQREVDRAHGSNM